MRGEAAWLVHSIITHRNAYDSVRGLSDSRLVANYSLRRPCEIILQMVLVLTGNGCANTGKVGAPFFQSLPPLTTFGPTDPPNHKDTTMYRNNRPSRQEFRQHGCTNPTFRFSR